MSKYLAQLKSDMFEEDSRYYIYFPVILWKMTLFLVLFLAMSFGFGRVSNVRVLFNEFGSSFGVSEYSLEYEDGTLASEDLAEVYGFPQKVIITQVSFNHVLSTQDMCSCVDYYILLEVNVKLKCLIGDHL